MIKRFTALIMTAVLCAGLAGCGRQTVSYEPEDYMLSMDYSPDFRILQLTDIHLSNKDDRARQYRFLDTLIGESDADLIILTGDMFTFADRAVAKELFAFLDGYGIPWTVTFGNHDEQCYFSIEWLTSYLNGYGSNCMFRDLQDDDIYGNANFAINLMQDGKVKTQLIVMDSNRYNFGESWGYDYIKEDQIAWYERLVDAAAGMNGGETVPSLAFFHIPLPEFQTAWDDVLDRSPDASLEYGTFNEKVCCPDYNTGLFDVMKEKGSTKAVIVGHDHINNGRLLYQGIYLCYGVTSTDRIYYEDDMLGSQVIIVKDDNSLEFEPHYHTYSEVE